MGALDSARNAIAENLGGPATKLATHKFSLSETPSLTGKVAVVTGGSEGIGYGVTHTFLTHDIHRLFILSLSEDVVRGAQAAVADELGQDKADRTTWIECDLADWGSIKGVAEQIGAQTQRLDVLVNNAGLGAHTFGLSALGVDRHMAINHFGHALLTSHLFPLLKSTAEKGDTVRITNTASNMHQSTPSSTRFESLDEINQDLGASALYGRSKLANILFARWFNRNVTQQGHPNIIMNATHPGFVSSRMSKEQIHEPYPLGGYGVSVLAEPLKKDQFEGAVSTVYAATVTKNSGEFICPPAVPEPGTKMAQDEQLADRLMELTKRVIGEKLNGGQGKDVLGDLLSP
ncbi:hypothetical protein S40285_08858 [Stachybotrys chlorohalonatus IBT 40285]|uniref:Uncharacterized protein n=1 Tax=Stachybotrys chlorohalonatus (strain IBT 40285) TaxID=1283841 RepID=A0A084QYF4_STAC4|nr:hypothetical protein S40285_08858 [Stachybotrys chlorohalonata IBT 40285]